MKKIISWSVLAGVALSLCVAAPASATAFDVTVAEQALVAMETPSPSVETPDQEGPTLQDPNNPLSEDETLLINRLRFISIIVGAIVVGVGLFLRLRKKD